MTEMRIRFLIGLAAATGIVLIFAGVFIQPLLSVARDGTRAATSEPQDAIMQQSLDEKQIMEARAQEFRDAGRQSPAERAPLNVENLASAQRVQFRTGIIEGEPGPFYSGDFVTSNAWQERTGTGFIQVFAGASGQDPMQGAVVVLIHDAELRTGQEMWYLVPEKTGPVRITEVKDLTLTLRSTQDVVYYFDVAKFELRNNP